jgi:flagellar assembly protein FliH
MPSSNWRLIRTDGETAGLAPDTTTAAPIASTAAATLDSATVLRGQSHAGGRRTGQGGSAQAPSGVPAPVAPAGVDQFVLAEEAQRIQREAEQRGYEMGRARAEAELRAAVDAASAMAEKVEAVAPERTSEIAHSIAELALSVAKRIIQHEVRVDPSLLCASLEAAVSTINGSPEAHVLLNPSAVEPVAEAWEALHGRAYLGKKWTFQGDPTLPVGGCTLRYEHGFVEAGLEAQLEEIGIALDRAIPGLARGTVDEEVA